MSVLVFSSSIAKLGNVYNILLPAFSFTCIFFFLIQQTLETQTVKAAASTRRVQTRAQAIDHDQQSGGLCGC